jgi:hypothetical protein
MGLPGGQDWREQADGRNRQDVKSTRRRSESGDESDRPDQHGHSDGDDDGLKQLVPDPVESQLATHPQFEGRSCDQPGPTGKENETEDRDGV